MTWFKVDDGLHKHRKRVRAGLTVEGFAAMGLWTVAGSWSADELTDGWIPDDVIDYLAPGIGKELATRLERAGLWCRVTRDGDEGWQFHEWTDHQPTREQVLAERAAAALRQKRARDRAREKRDKEGQDGAASRRDSRVTNTETHGDVTPAVTVPPTRPDPTNLPSEDLFGAPSEAPPTEEVVEAPKRSTRRATRLPDDFQVTSAMVAWAAKNAPHVDGRRETQKFCNYWHAKSGKDATKVDWKRTWENWMLTAEERSPQFPVNTSYRSQSSESNAPKAIPAAEVCPKHRGHRAGKCGLCRAEAHGVRQGVAG